MENSKQDTISKIIKISIGIVFAIFFIILLSQYITIANLNAKASSLHRQQAEVAQTLEQKNNQYNDINDNYDKYVEDYARDNYDYVDDGEILFNK